MKNTVKFVIIAIISTFLILTSSNCSFATNTTDETNTTVATNTTNQTSGGQITTTVSSTSSADSSFLSIGNIINILLIAVGIVIILLAIAILTKLKK